MLTCVVQCNRTVWNGIIEELTIQGSAPHKLEGLVQSGFFLQDPIEIQILFELQNVVRIQSELDVHRWPVPVFPLSASGRKPLLVAAPEYPSGVEDDQPDDKEEEVEDDELAATTSTTMSSVSASSNKPLSVIASFVAVVVVAGVSGSLPLWPINTSRIHSAGFGKVTSHVSPGRYVLVAQRGQQTSLIRPKTSIHRPTFKKQIEFAGII